MDRFYKLYACFELDQKEQQRQLKGTDPMNEDEATSLLNFVEDQKRFLNIKK